MVEGRNVGKYAILTWHQGEVGNTWRVRIKRFIGQPNQDYREMHRKWFEWLRRRNGDGGWVYVGEYAVLIWLQGEVGNTWREIGRASCRERVLQVV